VSPIPDLLAFFIAFGGLHEVVSGAEGEDNADIWVVDDELGQGAVSVSLI
jgi:hypothetical protein